MSNLKTSRQRLSLDEAMQLIGVKWTGEPNIHFDPKVKAQYRIRRGSSHDGTLVFSIDLMREALEPLFAGVSYFKPSGEPPQGARVRYTIGRIKRFSVYGRVKLRAGTYPGERECVVVPVRCEYEQQKGK